MKTIIISTIILLLHQMSVFTQNRICGWDIENISAIEIEYSFPDHEKELYLFNKSKDMEKIISFLKNVNFIELNSSNVDSLEINHDLEYKISFKGQRDRVYLCEKAASIGKTSFLLDPNVIREFKLLLNAIIEQ